MPPLPALTLFPSLWDVEEPLESWVWMKREIVGGGSFESGIPGYFHILPDPNSRSASYAPNSVAHHAFPTVMVDAS